MSWLSKNVKDIKPFIPSVPYADEDDDQDENEEKKISKSEQNKRGGIIAYTDKGDLYVVLQNNILMTWSFPKGHFEIDKDHSILDTAIREFCEETKYPGYIDPARLTKKMVIAKKHVFYLFKMTPEEVKILPIIKHSLSRFNRRCNKEEVIESRWINLSHFDTFRQENHVNKTISEFNIPRFLELADLSSSSASSSSSSSSFGKNGKNGKRKKSTKKKSKYRSIKKRKSGMKKSKRVKRKKV